MRTFNLMAMACVLTSALLTSCGGGGGGGQAGTAVSFLAAQSFAESNDVDVAVWGISELPAGLDMISEMGVRGFDKIRSVEFVGTTLYGVDARSDCLCIIDTSTGIATPVGPTGFDDIEALAYDDVAKILYAADTAATLYRIDLSTGRATELISFGGVFENVNSLAFRRSTGRLYFYDNYNEFLVHVDPLGGSYVIVGSDTELSAGVQSLTFGIDGETLYAAVRDGSTGTTLVVVDPAGAAATVIGDVADGGTRFQIAGMDFHPTTGVLFAANDDYDYEYVNPSGPEANALVTINPSTGTATMIGMPGTTRPEGLAFDPNADVLYMIDAYTDMLSRIDVQTGKATPIGKTGEPRVDGLAFDPNTNTLYGASMPFSSDGLYANLITINTTTGAGTVIAPITGHYLVSGLAFDAETSRLYGCGEGEIFEIDESTGSTTPAGFSGFADFAGLEWDPMTHRLIGSAPSTGELIAITPSYMEIAATIIGVTDGRGMNGLAYDQENGTFYGVNSAGVARLDRTTARASFIGCSGLCYVTSSAYDPITDRLYVIDSGTKGTMPQFAAIDGTTGEGTIIAVGGAFSFVHGLAFDRTTGTLYGIGREFAPAVSEADGYGYPELIRLDVTTGERFSIAPILSSGTSELTALAFDSTTSRLYACDDYVGDLFRIDTTTAELTLVGSIGHGGLGCLTFDHVVKKLYGVNYSSQELIEVDPATGAGTVLGIAPQRMGALESVR